MLIYSILDFHPLCSILWLKHEVTNNNFMVKSITEGVHISCGSVQWANPPNINTPCVNGFRYIFCRIFCRGSVDV